MLQRKMQKELFLVKIILHELQISITTHFQKNRNEEQNSPSYRCK